MRPDPREVEARRLAEAVRRKGVDFPDEADAFDLANHVLALLSLLEVEQGKVERVAALSAGLRDASQDPVRQGWLADYKVANAIDAALSKESS